MSRAAIHTKMSTELRERVAAEARRLAVPISTVVKIALVAHLDARDRERQVRP